jgi:aryl-alcohol dehydrogenase-like predicted oxidoreductase
VLAELGIGATLYGVFSRGLLTGSKPQGRGDFRAFLPRFSGDHKTKNEDVVAAFAKFAKDRDMTAAQLAIAWVRARQPALLPLVGARTRSQLDDSLGALGRSLAKDDLAALETLVPAGAIGGDRYAAEQMRVLDSER